MNSASYVLNGPDVITETFDTDTVFLNLKSGEYFNIGERAKAFVDGILEGQDADRLLSDISQLDADAGAQARSVFDHLLAHQLIRAETVAQATKTVTATAILAAGAAFVFEVYDDFAELIAADPIHDVEPETGWGLKV